MATKKGLVTAFGLISSMTSLPAPGALPGGRVDEGVIGTWLLVLDDVDDERLLKLAVAWVRSDDVKFNRWPAPGALLHALEARTADGKGAETDSADMAFGEVLAYIRRHGAIYSTPTLDGLERFGLSHDRASRIIDAVAACGGWRTIALTEEGDLGDMRWTFRRAWDAGEAQDRESEGEAAVANLLTLPTAPRLTGSTDRRRS